MLLDGDSVQVCRRILPSLDDSKPMASLILKYSGFDEKGYLISYLCDLTRVSIILLNVWCTVIASSVEVTDVPGYLPGSD